MRALKKFYIFLFLLAGVACTIIEDSDIMEESEMDDLKLIGIDIVQESDGDESTTSRLIITDDEEVNMSTPNGTVTRIVDFEIDNFIASKMKFRSGITGDLNGYIFYLSDGRPHTFAIGKGDTVYELYSFKYNTAEKLVRIITFSGEDEILTSDSLIYNTEGYITSLAREAFAEGGFSGTISMSYAGGNPMTVNEVSIGNVKYQNDQNAGGCPNNSSPQVCTSFYRFIPGGGGGDVRVVVRNSEGIGVLNEFSLEDRRFNVSQSQFREPDVYYFHPIMAIREDFDRGEDLLAIYIIDWWSIGATLSSGGNGAGVDEYVQFRFNYGF